MLISNDSISRSVLNLQGSGPSDSRNVAALLRLAAARLDGLDDVDIHDITLTTALHSSDATSLTIYFDRRVA